jgi:hypothetical protein
LNNHKVEVIKLEQLAKILLFLNWDDGMDVDLGLKCTHMYVLGKHTCVSLNYQIWSSYASSRGGQSSVVGWWVSHVLNLNAIFEACLLWVVAQIAKESWFLQRENTYRQKKLASLLKS